MSIAIQYNVTNGQITRTAATIDIANLPAGSVKTPPQNGAVDGNGIITIDLPDGTDFSSFRIDNIPGFEDVSSHTQWVMLSFHIDSFPLEDSFNVGIRRRANGEHQFAAQFSTDTSPNDLCPLTPMPVIPPGWDPFIEIATPPAAADHVIYIEVEQIRDPKNIIQRLENQVVYVAG